MPPDLITGSTEFLYSQCPEHSGLLGLYSNAVSPAQEENPKMKLPDIPQVLS